MTPKQKQIALTPIRAAIKGWAFSPAEWIPFMITQAEEEKQKLPASLHRDADEYIQPLRNLVTKWMES